MYLCPRCHQDLAQKGEANGLYWHCERCGRNAVGLGVVRRHIGETNMAVIWRQLFPVHNQNGDGCPTCSRAMTMATVELAGRAMTLDFCRVCEFAWFDAGEYEALPLAPSKPRAIGSSDFPDLSIGSEEGLEMMKRYEIAEEPQPDDLTSGLSRRWVLPRFLLTIFVGAMALGPLIYFAVAMVWDVPFHRAMDRALLISAVAALGLFRSRIPLRELWPWDRRATMQLLLGYFIAAVSIQAMVGANLALSGFTSAHLESGKAWGRVLLALVAALIVPPLEETVFRGFVQRELVAGLGVRAGLVLGAVIYMLAHFLKIPVELDHGPVHLWSGATALGAAFANFGHDLTQSQNLGKAANLFLIGLILGGTFLRNGALWVNAGLHSGWIFGLLLFTGFTRPVDPPYVTGFGGDILSSFSTTLVLVLLGLWIWRYYRHPSIKPEAAPTG